MIKLFLVLFSAALFVDFAKNEEVLEGEIFRPNESFLREWTVKINSFDSMSYAFGLFIGANEFLTFSLPLESIDVNQSLFVTNELQNPPPNKTNLHVNAENVFFGLEFSKELNESQRPFALLKTDEPVISESEITNHTFIKVAQNFSDVDPTSCFILTSVTSEETTFVECPIQNADSVKNTDNYFSCIIEENDDELREGGLFCYMKNQPEELSLVGLTSNGETTIFATGETLKTVVNLTGLNITALNQSSV
ncbi:uncharacterized protein LOC130674234 [Microplitis mediator]|uniref:uncharacterized protein LOC130674234 n=1 Tax=Microplitis mediator TaxID=375433 RepID=UPI002552DA1A|nr:uncharacterized protein LOC130674234 [Microplitis mediator]